MAGLGAGATFLMALQGCSMAGSGCSDGLPHGSFGGPEGSCSDSNHFVTCEGGEGSFFERVQACPTDAPLCSTLPDWRYHVCRSPAPVDCVSDLPDIAGTDLHVADL